MKFRKRLIEAGVFVVVLLLSGIFAGVRSVLVTRDMNQWVAHTQEVINEAAQLRLTRARMQYALWLYRTGDRKDSLEEYTRYRSTLRAKIAKLRKITEDNQNQKALLNEIEKELQAEIEKLEKAAEGSQDVARNGRAPTADPILRADSRIPLLLDKFEAAEQELFAERTAAVEKSARRTLMLVTTTGVLALVSLLFCGYYVQREVLTRAQVEAGLRRARELMGTQLDVQRSELSHAMEDLHTQIVARKTAEEGLRQLNTILEERIAERTNELEEKNRELESFNYSVSHDLRAPLRHMDGFSKILEEEHGDQLPEGAKQHLGRIRAAANRMSALVNDLLELSQLGRRQVKCGRVALGEMFEEVKSAYAEEEKGREIIWRTSRLPGVEADPGLLRQVLANLISNALKFTRHKSPAMIEVGCKEEGNKVTVFVRDNGAGFDPKFADKLFGVFQRLHRQDEFEGTGIGLAIVARIVQKHGGRVWAESAPDRGATFYFTLTAARGKKIRTEETIGVNA